MLFSRWHRLFSAHRTPGRFATLPRPGATGQKPRLEELETRLAQAHLATILINDPPPSYTEGTAVSLTAEAPDAVAPTYAWSVTRDGEEVATGSEVDFTFTPDDNGTYEVSLTVTDEGTLPGPEDDHSATASETLTVDNVAPSVAITGPGAGVPGQELTFTLTATDASTADAEAGFHFHIDWDGDGQVDESIPATAGTTSATVSHVFTAKGNYTIRATAEDKDGGVSEEDTLAVTVKTVTLENDELTIGGTTGNDVITIVPAGRQSAAGSTVRVFVNRVYQGKFAGVKAITAYAQAGNDRIHLAGSIKAGATLYGGDGNDWLKSAAGSDVLIGGEGNDFLNAHTGHDVLIGGAGADHLLGGPGDDLLIAGTTAFDEDEAALEALQELWGGGSYASRVEALRSGAEAVTLLASGDDATVQDDDARDVLNGVSGTDWLFATVSQDWAVGRLAGELMNDDALPTPGGPKGPKGPKK